eukprot:TRINITY_DN17423_c0_g1_i1.p2 TRINITY_DN17423_c0_g1~~TRINITY_DN17423_c0_g1_i1.p2  ORF type:complete len:178 (+),score=46.27 TRINITY_DN17423_c0_g1_i1:24-536(+)
MFLRAVRTTTTGCRYLASVGRLTHIEGTTNQPAMVDVHAKTPSLRTARAQAVVRVPPEVVRALAHGEILTPKGPVFATAIVAGTMAAKRCSDLIPFCHPLALERCDFTITAEGPSVVIECCCGLEGKTGVEMEALTGASIAALTVYDMCKSLAPPTTMTIEAIRLLEKTK